MPHITVHLLQGKTVEQKRVLAKDITKVVTKDLGLPSEDMVDIHFVDVPT